MSRDKFENRFRLKMFGENCKLICDSLEQLVPAYYFIYFKFRVQIVSDA